MSVSAPLILSLWLDSESFQFFDSLRQRHFPPERNFLSAHLTLFHHLPGESVEEIRGVLDSLSSAHEPFPLDPQGFRSLGNGVAAFFESPPLARLHLQMQARFGPWLKAQDRQKLRPHITVQNKVPAESAAVCLAQVQAMPIPEPKALGLRLFRYLGGPWELISEHKFGAPTKS